MTGDQMSAVLGECCVQAHLRNQACDIHGPIGRVLVAGVDVPSSATHRGALPWGTFVHRSDNAYVGFARSPGMTAVEDIESAMSKIGDRAANANANDSLAEHDIYQLAIEHLHEALRLCERAREAGSKEERK